MGFLEKFCHSFFIVRYENFKDLEAFVDELKYNGFVSSNLNLASKELIKKLKLYFKVQFTSELKLCNEGEASWFDTTFLSENPDIREFCNKSSDSRTSKTPKTSFIFFN